MKSFWMIATSATLLAGPALAQDTMQGMDMSMKGMKPGMMMKNTAADSYAESRWR